MGRTFLRPKAAVFVFAALLVAGGILCERSPLAARAVAGGSPGIAPVKLDTPTTDHNVYPPEMRVGGFDGKYVEATAYRSARDGTKRVAFWESEPGVLKTDNYPIDEFVYVIEGHLVTSDVGGKVHEFRAGDTFVIPKGWAGTWDMKSHFKKLFVNF